MRRPAAVRENCGTTPLTTIASLSLLELELPSAELLEDLPILLLDFASLELDLASLLEEVTLELDFAELDDATLELLGIDFHSADITKLPDAVEGIAVTISSPSSQPKNV